MEHLLSLESARKELVRLISEQSRERLESVNRRIAAYQDSPGLGRIEYHFNGYGLEYSIGFYPESELGTSLDIISYTRLQPIANAMLRKHT